MSEDEKIGQLFIVMNIAKDNEEEIKEVVEKYHPGGLRWQGANTHESWNQNRLFQKGGEMCSSM